MVGSSGRLRYWKGPGQPRRNVEGQKRGETKPTGEAKRSRSVGRGPITVYGCVVVWLKESLLKVEQRRRMIRGAVFQR